MHDINSTFREAKGESFYQLAYAYVNFNLWKKLISFCLSFVLSCVLLTRLPNRPKCYFFNYWIVELILDWFVRGYVGLKLFKLKQEQAPRLKRRSTNSFNILVLKCVSVHTSYQEKLYKYTTQW